jgi:hypothetical protein
MRDNRRNQSEIRPGIEGAGLDDPEQATLDGK